MTEWLIIISNFLLFFVSLALTIVTGIDNHAMAKIAALAVSKIAPTKIQKYSKTSTNVYKGHHEKE